MGIKIWNMLYYFKIFYFMQKQNIQPIYVPLHDTYRMLLLVPFAIIHFRMSLLYCSSVISQFHM